MKETWTYIKGLTHFYILRRHRNLTYNEIKFLRNSVGNNPENNKNNRLILRIIEYNLDKIDQC